MKRLTATLVAVIGAVLVFSALATAGKPEDKDARKLAAQQCHAEKKADKAAFKATYGKRAMRTCIKGEKTDAKAESKAAKQACKDERAADEDLFGETYGTNKNGKNAYGKCVSAKVDEEDSSDVEGFKNAAKECKSERAADRDAFKETYGSNKNGKNAYGKCVSAKSDAADDEEEPTSEV